MALTSEFVTPMLLFSGKNYDFWSLKMQACLQGLGRWELVELGFTELDANTIAGMIAAQRHQFDEIKQKEGRAKSCILNSLDDSIFPKINATKTASIWDILKVAYQGNYEVKMVKLQNLITQFETI